MDQEMKAMMQEFRRTGGAMAAKKARRAGAAASVKPAASEEMVTVTQAELDEMGAKVGLSPGCSFQQIQQRTQELMADENASKASASAAAASAVAEDRRILAAAIKDGRIPGQRQQFWADAMKRDRKGIRALIALTVPSYLPSSSAATRTADTAADTEMADAYAKVTGMPLSRTPVPQASPAASPPQPVQHTADDALYAEVGWKMGPALRGGLTPPPSVTQTTYWEPVDAPVIAMNADGTGQWADPGQAEREKSMNRMALEQQRLMAEQAERDTVARAAYRTDRDRWGLI